MRDALHVKPPAIVIIAVSARHSFCETLIKQETTVAVCTIHTDTPSTAGGTDIAVSVKPSRVLSAHPATEIVPGGGGWFCRLATLQDTIVLEARV